MSAKSAVTVLRSPSLTSAAVCGPNAEMPDGADPPVATGFERAEAGSKPAPHFLQKRALGLTRALHAGQNSSSLRPHCSQKAASAGLLLPQLLQNIMSLIRRATLWPLSGREARNLR